VRSGLSSSGQLKRAIPETHTRWSR
jgi:hypothetical protein